MNNYSHFTFDVTVVIPLHKSDLPIGTLLEIFKQAGISREELNRYFNEKL